MQAALAEAGLLDAGEAPGFLRAGHFVFESGDHGDTWLALELLFIDPGRLRRAAARLAGRVRAHEAEVVVGPLIGGALFGQQVAAELGVAFAYAEPGASSAHGRRYVVPRALHALIAGRRALVVDDAINAGSATQACVRAIEAVGGSVAGVAALILREAGAAELRRRLGRPVEALLGVPWNTWPAVDCPLCRRGIRVDTVG